MNNSNSESSLIKNPYDLLQKYARDSKIKSKAYAMSEAYYRKMYRYINYSLIILTSFSTALSIFELHKYVLVGLNLSSLIILAYDKLIKPKEKEYSAHQINIEMLEINRNIKQYLNENNRTHDEIKDYSRQILIQMNLWASLAPPCASRYIKKATKESMKRIKTPRQLEKKIDIDIDH
jgi:hypothetical protein